jgi:hypothetical protein
VDIRFKGDCYGNVERSDAGRPLVEGNNSEDSKDISGGGKEFSVVLQEVAQGTGGELGESEVKEYLLHLLKERKVSDGTFRFYYSGLKFCVFRILVEKASGFPDQVGE